MATWPLKEQQSVVSFLANSL